MNELEWSQHAKDVMQERQIREEWVTHTILHPDRSEVREDGCTHYIRAVSEYGGRFLRVIVNEAASPNRVVTTFFDRRLGRKQ